MASKIKVDTIENVAGSGNVSLGSGHNLVVPGNITGQGTTTLTGDLTVDTDTLKVDSTNNRVGINTTSGPESLNIGGGGNLRFQTTDTVRIEYLNTSGAYALGTTGGASIGFNRPATGDDEIFFETHNGGVSHAERMRINKDGYITMPSQPMCFVTRISEQTGISSDSNNPTVLVLNTPIFNVGNHYNDVNGRWTAPVAGKYEFSWSYATKTGQASIYRTFLWKNGSILSYTQLRNDSSGNSSPYNFASRTAILDLAANDYVILQGSIDGSPSVWYSDSQLRTVLTVRLIA